MIEEYYERKLKYYKTQIDCINEDKESSEEMKAATIKIIEAEIEKFKIEFEEYKQKMEKFTKNLDENGYFCSGTITLSKKAVISDPAYKLYTWCAAIIDNILPGEYNCYLRFKDEGSWGLRVSEIVAINKNYSDMKQIDITGTEPYTIGVDSGMCGIYDYDYFSAVKEENDDSSKWLMEKVYPLTYEDKSGILRGGTLDGLCIVSSSGFGDGAYDLYTTRDELDRVVALRIVYIYEEE